MGKEEYFKLKEKKCIFTYSLEKFSREEKFNDEGGRGNIARQMSLSRQQRVRSKR